jgi:hypothetical protein
MAIPEMGFIPAKLESKDKGWRVVPEATEVTVYDTADEDTVRISTKYDGNADVDLAGVKEAVIHTENGWWYLQDGSIYNMNASAERGMLVGRSFLPNQMLVKPHGPNWYVDATSMADDKELLIGNITDIELFTEGPRNMFGRAGNKKNAESDRGYLAAQMIDFLKPQQEAAPIEPGPPKPEPTEPEPITSLGRPVGLPPQIGVGDLKDPPKVNEKVVKIKNRVKWLLDKIPTRDRSRSIDPIVVSDDDPALQRHVQRVSQINNPMPEAPESIKSPEPFQWSKKRVYFAFGDWPKLPRRENQRRRRAAIVAGIITAPQVLHEYFTDESSGKRRRRILGAALGAAALSVAAYAAARGLNVFGSAESTPVATAGPVPAPPKSVDALPADILPGHLDFGGGVGGDSEDIVHHMGFDSGETAWGNVHDMTEAHHPELTDQQIHAMTDASVDEILKANDETEQTARTIQIGEKLVIPDSAYNRIK